MIVLSFNNPSNEVLSSRIHIFKITNANLRANRHLIKIFYDKINGARRAEANINPCFNLLVLILCYRRLQLPKINKADADISEGIFLPTMPSLDWKITGIILKNGNPIKILKKLKEKINPIKLFKRLRMLFMSFYIIHKFQVLHTLSL